MNDVVKAAGRGVSADLLNKLGAGIAKSRAQTILPGGKPILRMLTDGLWVYGQDDTDVQDASQWAINPLSLVHGWVCWTNYPAKEKRKNELLGEVLAPVFDDRPGRPENAGADGEWPFAEAKGMDLRCITGEDAETEVVYKTSSVGGLKAFDALLAEVQRQLEANPAFICPVVEMQSDSYQHKTYGKTYFPIFTVVDWCDMDGNRLSETAGKPKAVAAPAAEPEKPKRQRRAAAPAETAKPAQQAEPEPDEDDGDDAPEAAVGTVAQEPTRAAMPRRRPAFAR